VKAAQQLVRSMRDQALLHDGLHLILVGTTDAVRTVVQSHTQVRSVFSDPVVLDPLEPNEVHQLLHALFRTQVLSRRYGLDLQDQLGAALWQRLAAWAARDAQTLQQLVGSGAVDVLPRKGVEPLQYLLAGATRLALG